MPITSDSSALLIVGHGSTVNPDSSGPTWQQAAALRERGLFREVACCFWKEEPSLRDALFFFNDPEIRDVYVVPNFISEGYFTQTVIPRELQLSGRLTTRASGQAWKYCEPVGNHPGVTELLLRRAGEIAPDVPEAETSLLIVGHGTALNDNSAVAAKREVEKIAALGRYASVQNAYMEEAPLISDWTSRTTTPNVVVVPFFISDGLHSYQDIPVLLGIEPEPTAAASQREVFRRNPYPRHGRNLYYASAIGTEPQFAEIILEQAKAFDSAALDLSPIA
ncbi:MAG: cobalamin biosynthesis protein CbiX [Verrucomicrobiota bacterium]|nr:cobalamin biosynthesis protein CbiX [Verrucomicrobiota bacterium]